MSSLDQLMTKGSKSEMDRVKGSYMEKKRSHWLAGFSTQGRHNSSSYWVSNTEGETGIKTAP